LEESRVIVDGVWEVEQKNSEKHEEEIEQTRQDLGANIGRRCVALPKHAVYSTATATTK
jgi:hypothetical protein